MEDKTEKVSIKNVIFDCQITFSVNNLIDKLFSKRKVEKILQKYNVKEYHISKYFTCIEYHPKKTVKKGRLVEFNGIETHNVILIGEEICKAFKEEKVLVKDFVNNHILYVNSK